MLRNAAALTANIGASDLPLLDKRDLDGDNNYTKNQRRQLRRRQVEVKLSNLNTAQTAQV